MRVGFRDLVVFTRDGAGGNPLAVIDHSLVPAGRWQETAARIGYSETVFLEPTDPPTVHIYTPERRLPFAGHPLVGVASLVPDAELIRFDAGWAAILRAGEEWGVTVTSAGAVHDIAVPSFGISARMVEMPLEYVVVEAASPDTVAKLDPADVAEFEEIYVWAWEEPGVSVRARFFAPGAGVSEDAATGSAAVALARVLDAPEGRLTVHQGQELGRPSRIRLAWKGDRVSIAGAVSDRGRGEVELD